MTRENFEFPVIEVIVLETEDVITWSTTGSDAEDEF